MKSNLTPDEIASVILHVTEALRLSDRIVHNKQEEVSYETGGAESRRMTRR